MKLVIFSGTSEGHALCRFVSACGGNADVYVATDYGAAVMEPMHGITVHEGRLDADAMAAVLDADILLVDATHPYAAVVSDNLRAACAQTGAQYERLMRPALNGEGVIPVPDTAAAVRWLNEHPGRALLTTGSKELEAFTAVRGWRERLAARVLPSVSVLEQCASLGFAGAQIVAMQGPFSHEMNAALLRQTRADILVTKDTGAAGGFAEKLSAAREVGATVLVIARPRAEEGKTLGETQDFLAARFGWTAPAHKRSESAPRFPLFVSLAGKKWLRRKVRRESRLMPFAAMRKAIFRAFFWQSRQRMTGRSIAVLRRIARICTFRAVWPTARRNRPFSFPPCARVEDLRQAWCRTARHMAKRRRRQSASARYWRK